MTRATDLVFRGLEALLVVLLAAMVVMVFGNVVLRYGFNSDIGVSEELSRYCLVWLTFIGAVVTFREHSHLGVETLVSRFGPGGRRIAMALSDLIVVACCVLFFWGTFQQAEVNRSNVAPVTGLSMIWVYGVGYFTSIGIGLLVLSRLVRLGLGQVSEEEVNVFAGEISEEAAAVRGRAE